MSLAEPPTVLPGHVQGLIDARLDTLDRMLLGRVGRADRAAITREVESQIHDLLAEQAQGEPTREDVLAVLARIDPPEAYLPEDGGSGADPVVIRPSTATPSRPKTSPVGPGSKLGKAGGVVGLVAFCLTLLSGLMLAVAFLMETELAFFASLGLSAVATIAGAVGFVIAATAGLNTRWAITGFVTGLAATLISIAMATLPWLLI